MANPHIEGDDEIVAEYDVFLSTGLAGDVHVFQFPLRPFSRPYEASSIELYVTDGVAEVAAREKSAATLGGGGVLGGGGGGMGGGGGFADPNGVGGLGGASSGGNGGAATPNPSSTSRFHMKCTLDVFNSDNFLAQVGRTDETQHHYEFVLGSAPFTSRSPYAIGQLREDGLHVCPVRSIQQFTPKVRPLVKERMQVPAAEGPFEAVGLHHRSTVDAGPAGGVTGTSGSNLRAREREMVKATRSYMLNADAATAQPLVFYPADAPESAAKRSLLTCSTITPSLPKAGAATPSSIGLGTTTDAYFPQDTLLDVSAEIGKKLVLRPGRERRQDHVADLVRAAQVITVAEVVEAMTLCGHAGLTEADLVPMLREHAFYIHGVWVSRVPGVKISTPPLREVVLAEFVRSKNGRVRRADINALITRREPALLASIHSILSSIAVLVDPISNDDSTTSAAGCTAANGDANADEHDNANNGIIGSDGEEDDPVASLQRRQKKGSKWDKPEPPNHYGAQPLRDHREWRLKKSATKEDVEAFAARFPQDYEFQTQFWERRRPMIVELISAINAGRDMRSAAAAAAFAGAQRPAGAAGGAGAPLSAQQLQQQQQQQVAGGATSVGAAAAAAGGSQADVWTAQIRAFVRNLFAEHGVLAKSATRQTIQARARDPRSPFYMATPDVMGTACRLELEGFTDSTFILQRANVPDVDLFRKYIIVAAKEKQSFGSADVVARAQRLIEADFAGRGAPVPPELQSIPKPVATRVISEVAEYKTGEKLWHLKTGLVDNLQ